MRWWFERVGGVWYVAVDVWAELAMWDNEGLEMLVWCV